MSKNLYNTTTSTSQLVPSFDVEGVIKSLDSAVAERLKKDSSFKDLSISSIEKARNERAKDTIKASSIKSTKQMKDKKGVQARIINKGSMDKTIKTKSKIKRQKANKQFISLGLSRFITNSKKKYISNVFGSGIKSYTNYYKKEVITSLLVLTMLLFVGMSSYIAYAYVISAGGDVLSKVNDLVILPESEVPKVYIIQSEKSEIFQNPLFNGIKVGDNVLSYPQNGKVIIYRSGENKIVNIVNTGGPALR
jgi:hypothetical protein